MNIDHINIKAELQLLEEVRDFYCLVFDMTPSTRPSFSNKGYWLYAGEKALIHLTESDSHKKGNQQGCFDHVAFKVEDLEGVISKLEKANVDYATKTVPDTNMKQIFFRDPAGVRVEVSEVVKDQISE